MKLNTFAGYVSVLALSLTGCATQPAPAPVATVSCPPLVPYSAAQEAAMGTALALLDPSNPLVPFIGDAIKMRAADRVCLGVGAPNTPPKR